MTGKRCDGKGVTVGKKGALMIPGASDVDVYDEEAGGGSPLREAGAVFPATT